MVASEVVRLMGMIGLKLRAMGSEQLEFTSAGPIEVSVISRTIMHCKHVITG